MKQREPVRGHIKGSNILLPIKALRAVPERARAVLPESAHHYLVDRIMVSSWYPESDGLLIFKAYVALVPGLGREPYVTIGRVGAHQHARDTYKHFVEERGMDRVLASSQAMWRSYHDTGSLVSVRSSERDAELELHDYVMLGTEWCDIIRGYLQGIAQVSTGGDVSCELLEFDEAARYGRWRLAWSEAPRGTHAG